MASTLIVNKLWNGNCSSSKSYNSKVSLSLIPTTSDIMIVIDADYFDDPKPMKSAGRYVGLWDYEVFEIFIASGSRQDYLEINVGPHGHYFLKMFTPYGADDSLLLESKPVFSMDKVKKRWSAVLTLPAMYLPEPDTDFDSSTPLALRWFVNATAIVGVEEDREYFSAHQLTNDTTALPNFHQPSKFQPLVMTESEEARMTRMSTVSRDKSFFGMRLSTAQSFSAPVGNNINMYNTGGVFGFGAVSIESQLQDASIKLKSEFRMINKAVLDKCYSMHLVQNEFAVLFGTAGKWKGMSYKKRLLVLTSKPRLLYFSIDKNSLKGIIPWGTNQSITAKKRSNKKFDIIVADDSRTYYWTLLEHNQESDIWIKAITQLDEIINKK